MPVWAIILVVVGAVICCALCGYGINTAVRRSKQRREQGAQL